MSRNLLPVLLMALLVFSSCNDVLAGVLAHWAFDSDFQDDSGNSNHLTAETGTDPAITNTAGDWQFGGGAVDLDGDDWLNMTTTLNFAASDEWSIAFWGRRDANAANQDGMVIGDAGTNPNFIWTPDNPSVVEGLRFRNASGTDSDYDVLAGTNEVFDWHHWVVVADGLGGVTVYLDKVSQGTLSPSGGTVFTADAVGQAFDQAGQIYYGQLDEVWVLDEAIGQEVVDSLYEFNQIPEPATLSLGMMFLLGSSLFPIWRRSTTRAC